MPSLNGRQICDALAQGADQWGTVARSRSQSAANSSTLSCGVEIIVGCACRLHEGSASWRTRGANILRHLALPQVLLCMPATASQSARRC